MPTEAKERIIAELAETFAKAKVVIATSYSGMSVNQMTDLRRQLRALGIEFRVVKNRLALRAAQQSGTDLMPQLLDGVTGMAIGYDDPVVVAKALDGYIKATRASLKIRNAMIDGQLYDMAHVVMLASIPSKEELVARLVSQLNAPLSRLVQVLNGTVQGLATVLQRRAGQLGSAS